MLVLQNVFNPYQNTVYFCLSGRPLKKQSDQERSMILSVKFQPNLSKFINLTLFEQSK